jgi:hypothetical protein
MRRPDYLRELQKEAIGRLPPGVVVFFRPTEEFLLWLKARVGGRTVVDAGCGTMHFVNEMTRVGIRACGIDLRGVVVPGVPFIPCDASEFPYPAGGVVTIARPDASGWVEDAVEQAFEQGVEEVIYIGGHKERDLQKYLDDPESGVWAEQYNGTAGAEGERIFILRRKEKHD